MIFNSVLLRESKFIGLERISPGEHNSFYMNILAVIINGIAQIEYRRDVSLSDKQREYLDRMDSEMDSGIELGGTFYANPTVAERTQFVAGQLIQSIQADNEQRTAATCSYLADRIKELKQVKATLDENGSMDVNLVFTERYTNQIPVSFSTSTNKKDNLH
jgi:hypothetical protein